MPEPIRIHDFEPEARDVREEIVAGLGAKPKQLSAKLFYDARGSRLFERITELDEYYLTRTETAIMTDHAAAMATRVG
ncbi:MAG: L-histidine N(alpha)-methyltransferase, partial [Candidatus Krumholzibacteria bacterium]|nr:L-histidine N(alpha)-methyltransferase [Candidatus Krumholzibacteria bacterium]